MRKNPDIIVVIGILSVVVGFLLLLYGNSITGFWHLPLSHLGGIAIGAGTIELLFHYVSSKDLVENVSTEVISKMNLDLLTFYQSRSELESTKVELEKVKDLWLMWHTGSVIGAEGILSYRKKINNVRLIVTDPESNHINELTKISLRPKNGMKSDINILTEDSLEQNIDVRWFDGPIGNSVLIADPESPDGWARIEILMPLIEPVERPSVVVSKKKGKTVFDNIIKTYLAIWKKSKPPRKSTYHARGD